MERRNQLRQEKGSSLATVMIIGMVASMLVMGMFGAVMPSYQRVGNMRMQTALRNAAEAGIDWALQQYNANPGAYPSWDAQTEGCSTNWTNVPSTIINPSTSNDSFTPIAQVKVFNQQPAASSFVYSAQLDSNVAANDITRNLWRTITVRAVPPTTELSALTVGGTSVAQQQASGLVKNLQVILLPIRGKPIQVQGPLESFGDLSMGPNFTVKQLNVATGTYTATGADINVGGIANLKGTTVGGDVYCRIDPTAKNSSGAALYTASQLANSVTGNTGQNGASVAGNVYSNGGIDSSWAGTSCSNNQYSDPNNNYNKWQQNDWGTTKQLAADTKPSIPLHPSGSQLITPITGANTYGTSGVTTTQNLYINATGTEISLSGKNDVLTFNQPTCLYLEGDAQSASVIKISGNATINTLNNKAQNLVIFYNGTGTLDLSGLANFCGVIIAPNATTTFSGNANITGAVMGQTIIGNGGGNASGGNITYPSDLKGLKLSDPPPTYKAVSWREF